MTSSWVETLQDALRPYTHQIGYGNLRAEETCWDVAGGTVTNLAIVYELPGGSTNQLNIVFSEPERRFCYLDPQGHSECTSEEVGAVVDSILTTVNDIPRYRRERLLETLERWAADGLSKGELLRKITDLLDNKGLPGGKITMNEMKYAIEHVVARTRVAT